MNGLEIKKEQRSIIIADTSWLYGYEFDKYEDIFNITPREALLTYLLYVPDTPSFDDSFYHYFEVMKTIKEDTLDHTKYVDDEKLQDACVDIIDGLYKNLSVSEDDASYVYVAWADRNSIVLYDSYLINENFLDVKNRLRYNYKFIFKNADIVNSIDVIFNIAYWHNLIF